MCRESEKLVSLDGVHQVEVNLATEQVSIDYTASLIEFEVLRRALDQSGYRLLPSLNQSKGSSAPG